MSARSVTSTICPACLGMAAPWRSMQDAAFASAGFIIPVSTRVERTGSRSRWSAARWQWKAESGLHAAVAGDLAVGADLGVAVVVADLAELAAVQRQKRVGQHVVADGYADCVPVPTRRTEMDAAVDTGDECFVRRCGEAIERMQHAGQQLRIERVHSAVA